MPSLLSKLTAGGLSAGIFLLWWPQHVEGEGLSELVLRGVLWSLMTELLIFAFGPLERRLESRLRRRVVEGRARVHRRLGSAPAPARTGGAVALACLGLALPVTLLADAPRTAGSKDERPEVIKQVIVKRPVVRKQVVVERVVGRAASPAAAWPRTGIPAAAGAEARADAVPPVRSERAGGAQRTPSAGRPRTWRGAPRRVATGPAPQRSAPARTAPARPPAAPAPGPGAPGASAPAAPAGTQPPPAGEQEPAGTATQGSPPLPQP